MSVDNQYFESYLNKSKKEKAKWDKTKLHAFLYNRKVEKDHAYTHVSFGAPWGKYFIPDADYTKFTELYHDAIDRTELHIIEKPKDIGPLVLDIDLLMENEIRGYLLDNILGLVVTINNIIKKYHIWDFNIMKAFVLEKEKPTKNEKTGLFKDGFHIIYPNLVSSRGIRYLILDELKQEVVKKKLLQNVPFYNPLDEVFDPSVVYRTGSLLYGSAKPEHQGYHLTHVFAYDMTEEDVDFYRGTNLASLLSIRRFSESTKNKLKTHPELDEKVKFVLEKYEGKKYHDDAENSEEVDNVENLENVENEEKPQMTHEEEVELIKKLTTILSEDRARAYDSWIKVCWALKTFDKDMKDTWHEFSMKCDKKYTEFECDKVWHKANDKGKYTKLSIYYWAELDSPDEFKELTKDVVLPNEVLNQQA